MTRRRAFVLACLLAFGPAAVGRATDVSQMMEGAVKLYEQGNYKKAMRLFLNVLNVDPGNAEAKEYRNRCMDKIVEGELGVSVNKPEKIPDLPAGPARSTAVGPNAAPPARTIHTFRPKPRPAGAAQDRKGGKPAPATVDRPTAKDILAQRDALVEDYRRRILGKESAVWLENKRREIEIVLYMNRIFLPMTDQLTTDAYPMLEAAAAELRAQPQKAVFLRAIDNMSPAVRHTMLDLPARRSTVVFSYFVHATFAGRGGRENAPALTVEDLAD